MDGHAGIVAEGGDVAADQLLDGPCGHRLGAEAILAPAAWRLGGGKQRPGRVGGDAGHGQPGGQPFDGFQVQGVATTVVL